jgi:hypothetical protein
VAWPLVIQAPRAQSLPCEPQSRLGPDLPMKALSRSAALQRRPYPCGLRVGVQDGGA